MKKTSVLLLILLVLSTATFASLKPKQIVGKWRYEINLSNTKMEGSFVFSQKNGDMKGESFDSEGRISKLSDIKVNKKNETLCFQLIRKKDVPIEFILTVDHNKFKGKGWISDTNFEITGDKITIE
jgi:hypothetical protein